MAMMFSHILFSSKLAEIILKMLKTIYENVENV